MMILLIISTTVSLMEQHYYHHFYYPSDRPTPPGLSAGRRCGLLRAGGRLGLGRTRMARSGALDGSR